MVGCLTRTPELAAMSWRKMLEQMIVSESPRCTKQCFDVARQREDGSAARGAGPEGRLAWGPALGQRRTQWVNERSDAQQVAPDRADQLRSSGLRKSPTTGRVYIGPTPQCIGVWVLPAGLSPKLLSCWYKPKRGRGVGLARSGHASRRVCLTTRPNTAARNAPAGSATGISASALRRSRGAPIPAPRNGDLARGFACATNPANG